MQQLALFVTDFIALLGIYLIITFSLRLQLGYAGIANFGLVLAFTGGAYTVGWLPIRLGMWFFGINSGLSSDMIWNNTIIISRINPHLQSKPFMAIVIFILTLIVAGLVGALLGFLSGYPAARLRGDYLAIALLALGEVLAIIGGNFSPLVGGALGVQVPDVWNWVGDFRFLTVSLLIFFFSLAVWGYMRFLEKSPMSRTLRAIRDNRDAASSLGKPVTSIRLKTLVTGGVLCSISGALYAFYTTGVTAGAYGMFDWTFLPWVMAIFGGVHSNLGVLLGTFLFVLVRKLITFYKYSLGFLPFSPVWLQYLLTGGVVLTVLLIKPSGLITEKPSYTISKEKLKQIASRVLNGS